MSIWTPCATAALDILYIRCIPKWSHTDLLSSVSTVCSWHKQISCWICKMRYWNIMGEVMLLLSRDGRRSLKHNWSPRALHVTECSVLSYCLGAASISTINKTKTFHWCYARTKLVLNNVVSLTEYLLKLNISFRVLKKKV